MVAPMSINVWGALARSFCPQLTHLFSTPTAGCVNLRVFAYLYPHPCKPGYGQNFFHLRVIRVIHRLGTEKGLTTTIEVVKLKVMKEKVSEAEPNAMTKKKSIHVHFNFAVT